MADSIYITGVGIISAIGNNVPETIVSLLNCKSGIGDISILGTRHKGFLPLAEVKKSNEELCLQAGVSAEEQYSRTSLLGIIAAKEAVTHSGLGPVFDNNKNMRTGLISATSVGGMDVSETVFQDFMEDRNKDNARKFLIHDSGDSAEKIGACLGIRDYISTISTACSSSANSIMFGARLIKNGIVDVVVAGGTDSLTLFTVNGFNSLMILDKNPCKPFDNDRKGLNLGEGAGFVVMESGKTIREKNRERHVICELKGYGNACDAYHQTASSPEGFGAYLAMKKAVTVAGLVPGDIDYINAHGTGTANNDLSEGIAVQKLFDKVPPISSTKGYTGHTLGASGGIEAVLSVLSIQHGTIFPNLNFTGKMKELDFIPETEIVTDRIINNVLSNSFGFGGNNSSLVFSRSRL